MARTLVLLVLSLVALTSPAAGGYRVDKLRGLRVLRVYPARQPFTTCVGGPAERCFARRAPADERHRSNDGTERVVYRGKKTLYRGTGDRNVAVGPEWEEWTVRDGKVVAAYRAVQVVQTGYSWLPSAARYPMCESYGAEDVRRCREDVEPVGAVPDLPPPTRQRFDFGCTAEQRARTPGARRTTAFTAAELARMVERDSRDLLQTDGLTLFFRSADPPAPLYLGQDWEPVMRDEQNELRLVTASCAVALSGKLYAEHSQAGEVVVAVCDRGSELTSTQLCTARRLLTMFLLMAQYDPAGPNVVDTFSADTSLVPSESRLEGGVGLEYLPIVLSGHGKGVFPTVVLTPPHARHAVVVQLQSDNTCPGSLAGRTSDRQLCTDPRGLLGELGRRVALRVLPPAT